MDELRQAQVEKVQEALDIDEIETDKGLNQELGLARAANTQKARAIGYLRTCQTFEVAFILHLMRDILAITNELNESLQKKEQDIANIVLFVKVVKKRLQDLRDEGWDPLIKNVSKFCVSEVRTDLLIGVACLNPVDSFFNFEIKKILRMAELYPNDFGENIMVTLKNQIETYIVDIHDVDERFSNLKGLGDLSEELVKTKKYFNYPLVFRLVKFALLLLVATAAVERVFLAMKLIKSELRNRMDDGFMSSRMRKERETKSINHYNTNDSVTATAGAAAMLPEIPPAPPPLQ
ncbi:hypothetical protein P3L10_008627 [Capsicum annuum]|uniref:uncharacterized protein LOC107864839 n=1 Tax=Capsicum annuum TaxID=4072 RepID=UPI001FB0AAD2|nr:uncharacterized protein LOC107864839 [Capsicum annuum]